MDIDGLGTINQSIVSDTKPTFSVSKILCSLLKYKRLLILVLIIIILYLNRDKIKKRFKNKTIFSSKNENSHFSNNYNEYLDRNKYNLQYIVLDQNNLPVAVSYNFFSSLNISSSEAYVDPSIMKILKQFKQPYAKYNINPIDSDENSITKMQDLTMSEINNINDNLSNPM